MLGIQAAQLASSSSDVSFLIFVYIFMIAMSTIAVSVARVALRRRRWEQVRSSSTLRSAPHTEQARLRQAGITQPFVHALENPDWEARSAAALALGVYGDESAVEPLTQVLLGDRNEVVRENAAQSLSRIDYARAVRPLTRVVRDYLDGKDKSTRLVMSCAKLLGETGSPEALSCLQELRERLEKGGLEQESRKVSKAVSKVKTGARAVGKKCCVCNLNVSKGDEAVRCPFCLNVAHKDHMLEWLHVRGSCPVCQRHVSESDLQQV